MSVTDKYPDLSKSMKEKTISGPINIHPFVKRAQDAATHSEMDSSTRGLGLGYGDSMSNY